MTTSRPGTFDEAEPARGFRLDATLHLWGTAFEEPAERPCSTAYGFETIYAELFAADSGRPVTVVAYELANTLTPKDVLARLVKMLGQPAEIDRSGEAEHAGASGSVVLSAEWPRGNHSFSVSLYGAPRPSEFGDGIGKIYLSWIDEEAAARPFVEQWRTASEAVVRAAAATEGEPAIFTVDWPIFGADDEQPSESWHALSMPELLATPKIVADRLGTHSFALWRGNGAWHLSHGRATVVLGAEPVQLIDLAPARGGGHSTIEVGPWTVRDSYKSASLAAAAELLARVPGLAIERHEGHDV